MNVKEAAIKFHKKYFAFLYLDQVSKQERSKHIDSGLIQDGERK